jgi:hypothetical protein
MHTVCHHERRKVKGKKTLTGLIRRKRDCIDFSLENRLRNVFIVLYYVYG